MADNRSQPINILLSREELLLVLRLLQANAIPGIDADPLGPLTVEGEELALQVAGRALRARELARIQANGSLALHNLLLTAVGVCAYARHTIFVYHWPENGATPTRYFGHIRGEDIVAHTRPEDVLHLFSLLPDKGQLIEQVLAVCEYEETPAAPAMSVTMASEDFVRVRELADEKKVDAAVSRLTGAQADSQAAQALVGTLAHSPRVSSLQTLKQEENGRVTKHDFTILQNNQHVWFIAPASGEASAPLQAQTTTRVELQSLLAEWI